MATRIKASDRGFNPAVEEWLNGWAVDWRLLPSVAAAEFDVERSLRNQARLGEPVDQEFVDRYAEAMKGGATFPAVVAARAPSGKLVIIDGNHRLVAAKKADYKLSVYEVTAKAQSITTMTFEANVTHGKATTEEERIHHAMFLIDSGMTKTEAAKRMNVSVAKVNKQALSTEAGRRADGAGIPRSEWEALPETARNRLSMINSDEALVGAVKLATEAGLNTQEVLDLVASLNDSKSVAKQMKVLELKRLEYADAIQDVRTGVAPAIGKRVRSPKGALASTIGFALVMPDAEAIVASLGQAEREEYAPRVDEAIQRLTTLRKALDL